MWVENFRINNILHYFHCLFFISSVNLNKQTISDTYVQSCYGKSQLFLAFIFMPFFLRGGSLAFISFTLVSTWKFLFFSSVFTYFFVKQPAMLTLASLWRHFSSITLKDKTNDAISLDICKSYCVFYREKALSRTCICSQAAEQPSSRN